MIVYLWLGVGAILHALGTFLHGKVLFGAEIAAEGALWTFLIGICFAALLFLGWAGARYVRLRAVDGRP
jgi:hypothetical protein